MPLIKSSIKDVRRTKARRARNIAVITRLRHAMTNVRKAASQEDAEKAYAIVVKLLDKAAGKGYIHKNKAARTKARLALTIGKLKAAA